MSDYNWICLTCGEIHHTVNIIDECNWCFTRRPKSIRQLTKGVR